MFLKRFAPKSLYGRFLLIIILPMVLVQIVATYMFFERHWKSVSSHMSASLGGEIALITNEFIDSTTEKQQSDIIKKSSSFLGVKVIFQKGGKLPQQKCGSGQKCKYKTPEIFLLLEKRITSQVNNPTIITEDTATSEILVHIEIPKGLLSISTSRKRITNPTTYIFIMWMTGSALILLIVAILFLRNQVRSITRLATAAENFGKGEEVEKFKPQGAEEVRKAATAFVEMKERIQRHISQRTDMLAGISHDLRTPLTRMKLQLAMLDDSEATKTLEKDVDEMEAMLSEYLDFLRGVGREEKQKVQLSELLQDIVNQYKKSNFDISLRVGDEKITKLLRPVAFKRCITNIINNAIKFSSRIVVTTDLIDKSIRIAIDDNGPGIPPEKYEEVFRPFVRLDSSRSHDTGGAGLGLAIVSDIVNGHGGEVKLDKSALGGLRVVIILPE